MEVKPTAAAAPPAGGPTAAGIGAAQGVATAQRIGAQWSAASPLASAAAPAASTLARTTEAQQQQERRQLQIANAQNLLQLLLLCDSGFNNSEAPPAGNAASPQWSETSEESVKGLHATVAAIAVPAASNLIAFVRDAVVKHAQALDGESASAAAAATGLFGDTRRQRTSEDPTLLAAQCLYLLSRHFQLTASVVKEALGLVDALYALLRNSLRSRLVALTAFSASSETGALNTLTWLCVFSTVNMVAVWKKLRSSTGALRLNELIQSNVASSIEAAVKDLRRKLRESVQSAASTAMAGGVTTGGLGILHGGASARPSAASLMPPAVYTWQVVMDSYLGVLTLAEGCLLRAKGSEQGYDRALDAFLGERVAAAASASGSSPASPASIAVHRGKVTKRMVELAPVPRTLAVPVGLLYIAPYEMMSYLFDEMLPLLRHVSELEVATHRRYVEQLEELPRISTGARGVGSGAAFQQRGGFSSAPRSVEGDGDDGWLRRTTRVGLYGEVVGEPFTSEMAHLLEALAVCLQHLPPEVLNPDLDSDCAATFFIFQNFVKHMRQVFATQRSGASSSSSSLLWETYTLKLMTRFLEVLAMIGRNPQYTQRVVVLLTDAQTVCAELQWSSLVVQALECAGFNSGVLDLPGVTGGGSGVSPSQLAAAAAAAPGSGDADDVYAAASTLAMPDGAAPRVVHRQFTRPYARKCQRQFISSFFLLLRQLFAQPALRSAVSTHVTLELALTFLFAPHQSQVMLGSTLSLISALVANASDAQLVWTFLEQRHLLQQPSTRSQRGGDGAMLDGAAGLQHDRFTADAAQLREPTTHEETLSLIGHCQYECTQGTFDITIGFLNLITALFRHDQPTMAALGVYTTVTHFIAQDVLCGVLKRAFTHPHERYTVFALAAAALRQALLVRFHGENGRTTVLPFSSVVAIHKAPADVVGEVVKLILDASESPYELLSHHRAAVRQALHLLITAVQTVQEQKIEQLLFDTRTTLNTDLAVRVLHLCSLQDTLLTKSTLQLLLLFPHETANQAAQYWSGLTAKYTPVLDAFAQLLHPLSTAPVVVPAPPELAQLDFDPVELAPGWPSALLFETKSLLLELLMRHADVTEPSLTAWMCGFYHEEYARHGRRARASRVGAEEDEVDCDGSASGGGSWWRTTLLTSVVEGACSNEVERAHPALAVKCVKLLYLLRANRLYGAEVVRPFLESVCQTLFLRLQHFRASQCSPVALNKYAYVLKLLALEACYTFRTSPGELRLAQNTSLASISVEVLLSLLHPFGGSAEGDPQAIGGDAAAAAAAGTLVSGLAMESGCFTAGSFIEGGDATALQRNNGSRDKQRPNETATIVSRDAAVDITSWLPQALQVLPAFPEKLPLISGGRSHLVPCATDGVVQYNMASLYEALQAEQARANKPPLAMAELREKLRPFIAANDCFFSYAAGVSFVEGWCQLVSVACSVVQGLSMSRLRAFALCILRGLDSTTAMTAAAQEQVCTRLCHCLSTVMGHLRKTTVRATEQLSHVSSAATQLGDAQWSSVDRDYDRLRSGSNALAFAPAADWQRSVYEVPGQQSRMAPHGGSGGSRSGASIAVRGQRRPREEEEAAALYGARRQSGPLTQASAQSLFATHGGDVSNLYSAFQRSQLAQAVLQRSQAERTASNGSSSNTNSPDAVAANTVLLQPLVRALVQWGTRVATIRTDLYISLLCLAETPGINLDDVVLWRSQKALLTVICGDICAGCAAVSGSTPSGAAGAVAGAGAADSRRSTAAGVADVSSASAVNGALSPHVQHAVALLVTLLQASAAIRDDFCNPSAGAGDGMGTAALRCTSALLQSVDSAACGFFTSNGCALGALLWHIRSTFDVLSVITLGHASRVLHSDLLPSCFAMQAWRYSTQVVLGYSQASTRDDQITSKPLVEQNKEVLRRLLLGTMQWVNLLLSLLGDAAPLLYEVQKFIRDNRSLIDYVFISPAAASSTMPGTSQLSATHLTLCAELSDCLRALSSSVLAVDCRALVDSMALPDLLNMLSSEETWRRGSTDLYDFADLDGGEDAAAAAGGGGGNGSGAASDGSGIRGGAAAVLTKRGNAVSATLTTAERGRDVVALTVRNLSHLLLAAEYGLRGTDADLNGQFSSTAPMLRFSASKRALCVQVARHVAHALVESAGARGHDFRLECYLYALHALVCLLHSFVLPIAPDATRQQTADDFMRYLQQLSLQDLDDALTYAHDAVYQLTRYNTDYRGAMQVSRRDGRPWLTDDGNNDNHSNKAGPQSLSNGMRAISGADSDTTHSPQLLVTPKSGPAGGNSEAFSIPSTPGLLPAGADGRRGGRDSTGYSGGTQRSPSTTRAGMAPREGGQHHHQHHSSSGGLPIATGVGAAGGQGRDPNTTVVRTCGGAPASATQRGSRATVLPATEDGEQLRRDSTLWDMLPSQDATGDEWTRVYDSFQGSGAGESGVSASGAPGAAATWSDVLNVENEVRQVKIAIANAQRATKGAMEMVRKQR